MKVYLAGSCSSDKRTIMQGIAEKLRKIGYEVYCPFELKIPNAWDMSQEEWSNKVFMEDIKHLDECEIVIMITPGRNCTAGTSWEQGYAYANGKNIIVIQYTDHNTSLMTFCGCNKFINSSEEELLNTNDFNYLLERNNKDNCKTILT